MNRKRLKAGLRKNYLGSLWIFLLAAVGFFLIQVLFSGLSGVDGYYHIKIARLYLEKGVSAFNAFPWLQFSVWKQFPADLSFFYHILMIPFASLGDLVLGAKLAASFFAGLVFGGTYYVLKKMKVEYAVFWCFLLFSLSPYFSTRLLYPRAFVFSILLFIIGVYLILKRRPLPLFFLMVVYALSYTGFPILIVVGIGYCIYNFYFGRKLKLGVLFSILLGAGSGILLRPGFPEISTLLFYQNVGPFLLKFQGVNLRLAAELTSGYSLEGLNLMHFLSYLIPALFFASYFQSSNKTKQSESYFKIRFLVLLDLALLVFTILAGRFIEYLVPITLILIALFWAQFKDKILSFLQSWRPEWPWIKVGSLILILVGTVFFAQTLKVVLKKRSQATAPDLYADSAAWLAENTKEKETIFNTAWPSFPQLFYYNHQNFYIAGMDPSFTYFYDRRAYYLWRNIGENGFVCEGKKECQKRKSCQIKTDSKIKKVLLNTFKSRYILVDSSYHSPNKRRSQELLRILKASSHFKNVFQDSSYDSISIFKVKE